MGAGRVREEGPRGGQRAGFKSMVTTGQSKPRVISARPYADEFTRVVELFLAAIALGAALAFGGVSATVFLPMSVAVVLLAAFVFARTGLPVVPRAVTVIVLILVAVPLLQMLPLPRAVVAAISPTRQALQEGLYPSLLPVGATTALSVNTNATLLAFLRWICYALVFILAFQSRRESRRGSLVPLALLVLGLFEAGYGIVQYLTGWQPIFTPAREMAESATGTFVNRNHYAGLLEMVLPFSLAGIVFFRSSRRGASLRRMVADSSINRLILRVVLFAVVFLGAVLSKSRGGILSLAAGLLAVLVIAGFQSRTRLTAAIVVVALLLCGGFSVWVGIDPVLERFRTLTDPQAIEAERLPIWRDTLDLVRDYPWAGTGLGTYAWASRHYQTHMLSMIYEHAHNDYLEAAGDLGIPVALLLFGSLWLVVGLLLARLNYFRHTEDKVLAAGCAGALISLLVHSLTDFNLQIPANALLFFWIAGIAAALVYEAGAARRYQRIEIPTPRSSVILL